MVNFSDCLILFVGFHNYFYLIMQIEKVKTLHFSPNIFWSFQRDLVGIFLGVSGTLFYISVHAEFHPGS